MSFQTSFIKVKKLWHTQSILENWGVAERAGVGIGRRWYEFSFISHQQIDLGFNGWLLCDYSFNAVILSRGGPSGFIAWEWRWHTWWVGARDAAEHPPKQKKPPTTEWSDPKMPIAPCSRKPILTIRRDLSTPQGTGIRVSLHKWWQCMAPKSLSTFLVFPF